MQQNPEKPKAPKPAVPTSAQAREERLKAALKANMGRRKAQARAQALARADDADDDTKNK
jgi:hypothetical protein